MTSSEDLSAEARHLLRRAKGSDRATRSEVAASVQRFRTSGAVRPNWRPLATSRPHRAAPWAVFVAILSGALGAYATVGQSLGLPVPAWWPQSSALPAFNDTLAERAAGKASQANGAGTNGETKLTEISVNRAPPEGGASDPFAVSSFVSEVRSAPQIPGAAVARGRARSANVALAARAQPRPSANVDANAAESAMSFASPSVSPSPPPVVTAGPLAREVESITAARDALDAGNCVTAARHLDAHRREFPKGALSEEREALSVICGCRQGHGASAAETFVARRPHSPLARRVATECSLDTLP